MEQIYYTQCPMGYGLGASNGFQIKRMSAGYPVAGDFRHLGLRAFLPGTKSLAPPALRYRRDGEIAEIAWITPRSHEYETERGRLWGRPGGQFAHGLRLNADEIAALHQWPAGLYDAAFWRRSDPEPTRGRPPDPFSLGTNDLIVSPTFADVSRLAEGFDPELLAQLWTALALMVREGRTLFVIAEPRQLSSLFILLTFAVPEPLRREVTFSTYHDRPEELPGYRLQGTTPSARPNRAALGSLGIVADLSTGQLDPRIAPSVWATTLAHWWSRHEAEDEVAWSRTCEDRASRIIQTAPPESPWSEDWLSRLCRFDYLTRRPIPKPQTREDWTDRLDLITWAASNGLAEEWATACSPTWWKDQADESAKFPEARRALIETARQGETWRVLGTDLTSVSTVWGEVVTSWYGDRPGSERAQAVSAILKAVPAAGRPSFLASLIQGFSVEASEEVLELLRTDPTIDPALLLPVDAVRTARLLREQGDVDRLGKVLVRALAAPGSTSAVLDVIAEELEDHPSRIAALAPSLADALEGAERLGRDMAWSWALRACGRSRLARSVSSPDFCSSRWSRPLGAASREDPQVSPPVAGEDRASDGRGAGGRGRSVCLVYRVSAPADHGRGSAA